MEDGIDCWLGYQAWSLIDKRQRERDREKEREKEGERERDREGQREKWEQRERGTLTWYLPSGVSFGPSSVSYTSGVRVSVPPSCRGLPQVTNLSAFSGGSSCNTSRILVFLLSNISYRDKFLYAKMVLNSLKQCFRPTWKMLQKLLRACSRWLPILFTLPPPNSSYPSWREPLLPL